VYLFTGLLNSGADIRKLNFFISIFDGATQQIENAVDNSTGTPYHNSVFGK